MKIIDIFTNIIFSILNNIRIITAGVAIKKPRKQIFIPLHGNGSDMYFIKLFILHLFASNVYLSAHGQLAGELIIYCCYCAHKFKRCYVPVGQLKVLVSAYIISVIVFEHTRTLSLFKTPFLSHGISRLGDYGVYDYGLLFAFTAFRRRCLV